MTKTTITAEQLSSETDTPEQALADELQLTTLIKQRPDFLARHPELLTDIEIPHGTSAASLIERQVELLRDKLRKNEKRMNGLLDIARDNDRLAQSRHRLAVNLIGARDLDDVISTALNELSNELDAEHSVIRLISHDQELLAQRPELFINEGLEAFATMLKHHNPVCGRATEEQKLALFGKHADEVASAAIIPLVAGAELGLLGLGSTDAQRFHSTMGTDFLRQLGDLLSAAFAVHLEQQD